MTAHVEKRSPHTALGLKTTEEMWSGSPGDYSGLRVFGCPAYAYVNDGKFEPRAKKCIFLGYTDGVKGYRLWDPRTSRIITSRDVTFNESVFLQKGDTYSFELPEKQATTPRKEQSSHQVQKTSLAHGRAKRPIKPPVRFGFEEMAAYALNVAISHFKLSSLDSPNSKEDKEFMSSIPYANAVRSIMYAIVCTQPDIAQAVSVVSRYMENPGKAHWQAVKWILRYLRDRKSTSGYVFCLDGSAISWRSALQEVTALSTTEAEYMALTEGFKEAQWFGGFVGELRSERCVPMIEEASGSVEDLSQSDANSGGLKSEGEMPVNAEKALGKRTTL
uniref:Retroviral polymerase SH3-like domain-containing protein n=1 Tax=Chenopodium quinoa TaxID=63459 RepID=A0A803MUH4_CHEQI